MKRINNVRVEPIKTHAPFDKLKTNGLQASLDRINRPNEFGIYGISRATLVYSSTLFQHRIVGLRARLFAIIKTLNKAAQ